MSFLNSISVFFPELSQLQETYPTNYATAKIALDNIQSILLDFSFIIKNHKRPLSNLEADYVKELNKRMKALKIRFTLIESEKAKEIYKQADKILENFIK